MTMTADQMKITSPAVFATEPVEAASNRYTFIPTTTLIADFKKLGWEVHRMAQQNSHTDPEHTKHIVIFRNPSLPTIGGNIIELLLVNSHNRLASFHFMLGIFRTICANGLIVHTRLFETLNIRHIGYDFEDLKDLTEAMLENMPKLAKSIKKLESSEMDEAMQTDFAYEAIVARFPEYLTEVGMIDTKAIQKALDMKEFIKAIRKEDEGDSVWLVYNRIQEKLMKGGFKRMGSKDGKFKQVRPVTNIGLTVKLNQKLWRLAESYSRLIKTQKKEKVV